MVEKVFSAFKMSVGISDILASWHSVDSLVQAYEHLSAESAHQYLRELSTTVPRFLSLLGVVLCMSVSAVLIYEPTSPMRLPHCLRLYLHPRPRPQFPELRL